MEIYVTLLYSMFIIQNIHFKQQGTPYITAAAPIKYLNSHFSLAIEAELPFETPAHFLN
jgi:hypothetical protein